MTRRIFLWGALALPTAQNPKAGKKASPGADQPTRPVPKPDVPGLRYTEKGEPVVPLVFPVLHGCEWEDTFGVSRDGGKRKHLGQDLPAEKMRPLLACFPGVWTGMGIRGDNGCTAAYYHLNDDTPGTQDGKGGEEFRVAPGMWVGTRVIAGQHVAYCGNSGNAKQTFPHLHFELTLPGVGNVNPLASLRAAPILKAAHYVFEDPRFAPEGDQHRLDGEVVSVSGDGREIVVRMAAWGDSRGRVVPVIHPQRHTLHRDGGREIVRPGDFIAVLGTHADADTPFPIQNLRVLRHIPPPRNKGNTPA